MALPSSPFCCCQRCSKILLAVILLFLCLQYSFNIFYEKQDSSSTHNSRMVHSKLTSNGGDDKDEGPTSSDMLESTAYQDVNSTGNYTYFVTSTVSSGLPASATQLPPCPPVPPLLVGRLRVLKEAPSMEELEKLNPKLQPGGRFRPEECQSAHKVAIIIPYRDRAEHLRIFLHNMHPMLQRQQVDYGIYVVEQTGTSTFNRAMLMNIGYLEALKQYDWQCFIFHDVDLIPEDDRNLYTCPEQPRHMSVAIDKFNYRLPYEDLFGGVSALTKDQFEKINGFSNEFWGWGGEDDDMSNRVRNAPYKISRYSANVARYQMMGHDSAKPNPKRYDLLYSGDKRFATDGINNLDYERVDLLLKRLYTWVYVKLPEHS